MCKGIGTKLLNAAEITCIEKKIKKLTALSLLESSDFYQKNGFSYKTNTGFYAQDSIWILCELFEKVLISTSTTLGLV